MAGQREAAVSDLESDVVSLLRALGEACCEIERLGGDADRWRTMLGDEADLDGPEAECFAQEGSGGRVCAFHDADGYRNWDGGTMHRCPVTNAILRVRP